MPKLRNYSGKMQLSNFSIVLEAYKIFILKQKSVSALYDVVVVIYN